MKSVSAIGAPFESKDPFCYRFTITLKPPYVIRLTSNGIGMFMVFATRGSFMTFALIRSRAARDLKTIHEKTTVSPALTLARRGNGTPILIFRSSPTHSTYWRAPCCRQTLPALRERRRYASNFLLGTARTNPSTYAIMNLLCAAGGRLPVSLTIRSRWTRPTGKGEEGDEDEEPLPGVGDPRGVVCDERSDVR